MMHKLVTRNRQEKCVDIMLAVEMLSMATVPEAYDIAVVVTGDKDFVPVMKKTREKGKRVAIASMRNSCNSDLNNPELTFVILTYGLRIICTNSLLVRAYNTTLATVEGMNHQLVLLAIEMLKQQPGMTSGYVI